MSHAMRQRWVASIIGLAGVLCLSCPWSAMAGANAGTGGDSLLECAGHGEQPWLARTAFSPGCQDNGQSQFAECLSYVGGSDYSAALVPRVISDNLASLRGTAFCVHLLGPRAYPSRQVIDRRAYQVPPKGAGTLAELYLSRVAQHARRTRKVYGGFLVALSSLLAAEAVAVGAGEPEALNGALAALVAWGVGLHSLGTPSNEERELKRVLAIQDLAKRERVGGQALGALSQCARARRLLDGLGWALAATYYLVAQPIKERAVETVGWDVAIVEKPSPLNYVSGALYSSFALRRFASRSVAEKAFREYREAFGEAEGARLRAYLDRRGRVGLGLRITL